MTDYNLGFRVGNDGNPPEAQSDLWSSVDGPYLYPTLLHGFLQLLFGHGHLLLVGLAHVLDGRGVEVVQL